MATSRLDLILNAQAAITSANTFHKALSKLGNEAKATQKVLDVLGRKPIVLKVSLSGAATVRGNMQSLGKSIKEIQKPVKVQVSASGIKAIQIQADSLRRSLETLFRRNLSITAKITGVKELTSAIAAINKSVGTASNKGIIIRISTAGTKEAKSALDELKKLSADINRIKPKVSLSATGITTTRQSAAELLLILNNLSKLRPKITLSATGIVPLRNELNSVLSLIGKIQSATVVLRADPKALASLTTALSNARKGLSDLANRSINIRTNLQDLVKLQGALEKVSVSIKAINATGVKVNVARGNLDSTAAQIKALQSAVESLHRSLGTISRAASNAAAGARTAFGNMNSSLTTARTSASGTATALRGVGVSAKEAAVGGALLGSSLNKVKSYLPQLRAVGTAVGLIGSGSALAGFVRLADNAQQIENRLKLVTDTTEELVSIQGELFAQARDARTDLNAQADLYQRIALSAKSLGVSQREVLAGTEAVSKAITISASSVQAANATIIQFGQALSFGKLRGDELRSVLEQAPRLAQALADGLGITRGELVKFGFDGKLASDRVFKALLSQLPQLRKEFAEITPRIRESSTTVVNSMTLMAQAINDTTGVTEGLSRGLLNFSDDVAASIPRVISEMAEMKLLWIELRSALEADFGIPGIKFLEEKLAGINDFLGGALTKSVFGFSADVAAATASILGIGGGNEVRDKTNEIIALQKELSDLSRERVDLVIDIDAFNAQTELGNVRTSVDGLPNTRVIEVIANGQKAIEELPKIEAQMRKLTTKQLKIEVQLNFEGQKKLLDEQKLSFALLKDKSTEAAQELKKMIELRQQIIDLVRGEGSQIDNLTKKERERLQVSLDQIEAAKKALIIRTVPIDTPLPGNRNTIVDERDADADGRKIQQFLDKQRALLAVTEELSESESELADLRARAGDEAVNKVSAVIEAYSLLNNAQSNTSDFISAAEKRSEALKEELEKIKEVSEADKLRQEIASRGVRTEAEERGLQLLRDRLLELNNLNQATQANVEINKILAQVRALADKLSPEQAERLRLIAQEIENNQTLIASIKQVAAEREKADALIASTLEANKSDRDKQRENIQIVETRLADLRATPEAERGVDYAQQLKDTEKVLELLKQGKDFVLDFGVSAESIIRDTAGAMADAMSTYFFRVMQSDFKDLTKDIGDTFKRTIDRMVADALAANLTQFLFGTIAGATGPLRASIGNLVGGGAPAAQFGAPTRAGDVFRVNETGTESFVDSQGRRSLLDVPSMGMFQAPDNGRIESAGFTKQLMQFMSSGPLDGPSQPSVNLADLNSYFGVQTPPLDIAKSIGSEVRASDPGLIETANKMFLKMGKQSGTVISHEDVTKMISGRVPGRRLGGTVRSGELYEVNEGGAPELLSIGSGDFMSRQGVMSPPPNSDVSDRVPSIQNVNMTIVTPDPDGFRKSAGQIQGEMSRMAALASRRNT